MLNKINIVKNDTLTSHLQNGSTSSCIKKENENITSELENLDSDKKL